MSGRKIAEMVILGVYFNCIYTNGIYNTKMRVNSGMEGGGVLT